MEIGKPATNRIWLVPGAKGLLRCCVSDKIQLMMMLARSLESPG